MNSRRTAGLGLLIFGVGTLTAMITAKVPGGAYEPDKVSAYIAQGHALQSFLIGYVGVAAALALLAFGHGIRHELPRFGETVWALSVIGAATSITGWFLGIGVVVSTTEGGPQITAGIPLPVAHTIGEIAGLLGGCAPALCVGVVAVMLWSSTFPMWLRACSVIAGACGILAPLYLTMFAFVLWTLIAGAWMTATANRTGQTEPELPVPSLV